MSTDDQTDTDIKIRDHLKNKGLNKEYIITIIELYYILTNQ